jgi:hypothetical protein
MNKILMEDLGNMNPGELEPRKWDGGDTDFKDDPVQSLPEKECMKARLAVFTAIMEEVLDEAEEEQPVDSDGEPLPLTERQAEEVTEPVVEKATALSLVPSSARNIVRKMVADRLRIKDKRSGLYARAAHLIAEATTDADYNAGADNIDQPIKETVRVDDLISDAVSEESSAPNEGTADTTMFWRRHRSKWSLDADEFSAGADNIDQPINNTADMGDELNDAVSEESDAPNDGTADTTMFWRRHARKWSLDADEEVTGTQPESDEEPLTEEAADVDVDDGLDEDTAKELRYLVRSSINHRRATSRVSRKFSGKLLDNMMHELRYVLPRKFCRKFNV